jgi:hypothetical protein
MKRPPRGKHCVVSPDLAQETFLRGYRSLGQYRRGAKLSPWLYRIAYHAFISAPPLTSLRHCLLRFGRPGRGRRQAVRDREIHAA